MGAKLLDGFPWFSTYPTYGVHPMMLTTGISSIVFGDAIKPLFLNAVGSIFDGILVAKRLSHIQTLSNHFLVIQCNIKHETLTHFYAIEMIMYW